MRFLNSPSIKTLQIPVVTSGVPVQCPSFPVPEGAAFCVKAKSTNTGLISIGSSSDNALNTSGVGFRLIASQGVSLQTSDPTNIWIDATVSGEGVDIISEF